MRSRARISSLFIALAAAVRLLMPSAALAQDAAATQDAASQRDAATSPPPLVEDSASREDGKYLRVYLATFEAGDPIFEKFGHDALWIVDTRARTDASYNWGMFNDKAPHFLMNFLRGRMRYSMYPSGPYPVVNDILRYRTENRTIWVQELNLTPTQKVQLRDFVNWNNRPENMYYMYDYFRDNCTTRIRDALDRVLHGQIRAALEPVPSGVTYRWQSRRLLSVSAAAYAGIELAMGHPVDRPLNQWENSFLPMELMNHLRSVNVRDDSGHVAPLVIATKMEYESTREPMPATPPDERLPYIFTGIAVAVILFGLAFLAHDRGVNAAGIGFFIFGFVVSLVIGIFGTIANLLWFATDHVITRSNENILQANVLSLVLAALLVAALFRRGRRAADVALLILVLSVLGLVIQVLPWFDQFNGEIIGLLLPIHTGLYLGLRRLSMPRPSVTEDGI